jgi:hypothetical protein
MGCCQKSGFNKDQEKILGERVRECIESNSVKRLKILMEMINRVAKRNEPLFIDKPIVSLHNLSFNALGYCVYLGSDKIFKELYEHGASLKAMEELYLNQNLRVINILCSKGHLDLLRFYLPLYIRHYRSSIASFKSSTLDLYDDKSPVDLPIHAACRAGMFHIVSFLFNQFKNSPEVPHEFNIYTLDDSNQEDASLIACRVGCFPLVKLLYEQCGMKFTRLNKFGEGAILICVKADSLSPSFEFLEVLTYLVDVVGLDVSIGSEKTLAAAKSENIRQFLEEKLACRGISVKSKEVNKRGEMNVFSTQVIRDSVLSSGLNDMFHDLASIASSIDSVGSIKDTPMSLTNIL